MEIGIIFGLIVITASFHFITGPFLGFPVVRLYWGSLVVGQKVPYRVQDVGFFTELRCRLLECRSRM